MVFEHLLPVNYLLYCFFLLTNFKYIIQCLPFIVKTFMATFLISVFAHRKFLCVLSGK